MLAKPRLSRALASLAIGLALVVPAAAIEFLNALDDSPIDISPIKGEVFTDAVKSFQETGKNPYVGNPDAIAAGKALYDANCQVCHKPDGSGGMGPSLIDNTYVNKRANTDVGMFEVIHSGAAGAMRPFSKRGVTQDQILQMIAYIHTLKK
ncbi:c-type cytochrome [Hyphomicrobium sp. xq]|uniref:C-type cytochrome n=1 Tax=Hyphomicrobium album TaxID=2665159 RepID=A0A6I3KHK7_9HYPH|nr:c-type cytochrome [Hyphomicrobium album]MTD93863.1 c-type cytochrome [Hyphomicrobium album]